MRITIDEAITRYKNNAEYERTHGNLQGCLEFRQLVEWLEKLQQIQKIIQDDWDKGYQHSETVHRIKEVLEDGNGR